MDRRQILNKIIRKTVPIKAVLLKIEQLEEEYE